MGSMSTTMWIIAGAIIAIEVIALIAIVVALGKANGQTVVVRQQAAPGYGGQPGGYPAAPQQGGYPQQQPGGYPAPPQAGGGYPPQGPAGFPPVGETPPTYPPQG